MIDYLKGVMGALAIVAVVLIATPASAALPQISEQTFAVWSPNYCATGNGTWDELADTSGGTHVELSVGTFSKTSSGTCIGGSPSTASSNTFAAWGKVEREYPYLSGNWSICKSAPWHANTSGTSAVYSYDTDLTLGCGSGRYRLRSENRITYGGVNQTSPPYVSSPVTF